MLTPDMQRWIRDKDNKPDISVMIEARHTIAKLEKQERDKPKPET